MEEKKDSESIIALTCFFCFIPVIFYIGTKLHSDVKERKNGKSVNYIRFCKISLLTFKNVLQ